VILRLFRLSLPYTGRMLLSVLLGTATVAAGVGLLSTSAYLIARAALQPSIAELQVAIVAVRAFGLLRGILRYLERLTTHSVAFQILAHLRTSFFNRIGPLAPAGLAGLHSGDLLTRIVSDIETLDDFFVRGLAPLGVALGSALAGAFFLATFDIRLGFELAGFFLLGGLIMPLIMLALSRSVGSQLILLRSRMQVAQLDLIQGLPDLLLAGATQRQEDLLAKLETTFADDQLRAARLQGFAEAIPGLLTDLTVLALILTLIPRILEAAIPGYMLPVLLLALVASSEAIAPLSETFRRLDKQTAAARRLFELADRPVSVQPPASPVPMPDRYHLEISGLSFRYHPGEPLALSQVDLRLPQGASLGLVGPSGAGKSTLISILTRLWPFEDGRIFLGDVDLVSLDPAAVRARMSVITQRTDFFTGTLRDNLLLARPQAGDDELMYAITQARLSDFLSSLPDGLDTWIGERGLTLSAGERQRVAIARTILHAAPILILDEFDAHLDHPARTALLRTLRELMRSRTTLIATHRLIGFEHLDRIIVFEGGKITSLGTHEKLLQESKWYAAAYAAQVQEVMVEELDSVHVVRKSAR
jgi:thiol reductant ABC exporter CydC subunit